MLQTQVAYWQNEEQKRHNRMTEQLTQQDVDTKRFDSITKSREADTNRMRAITDQAALAISQQRADTESINALTAQTEAGTRARAQLTNEQRLALEQARLEQDYDVALRNIAVSQQNADSTRLSAQSGAALSAAQTGKVGVETELLPYSTGANIAASTAKTVSTLAAPVTRGAKAIQTGIRSLLYNIRN